jgi:predicted phosphodiesterase
MIFITGDIHGEHDLKKFGKHEFPIQSELTRNDFMIICGDFGLIWDDSKTEKYWMQWLDSKPWTTLWIDGNHENYNLLKNYPFEEWNGGTIQKITPNIFHLCRGNMFELDDKKVFAFGGAESHDKQFRIPGKTIWEEEMPSEDEMQYGLDTLNRHGWKADIVITHSLPSYILHNLNIAGLYTPNVLTDYFERIDEKLRFDMWFSGHYHMYRQCTSKHYMIFDNIAVIKDRSFELV